jgi:hypothetical protein
MPVVTTDRVRMAHRVVMDSVRKATCAAMAVRVPTQDRVAIIKTAMRMPVVTTDRARMVHRVAKDNALKATCAARVVRVVKQPYVATINAARVEMSAATTDRVRKAHRVPMVRDVMRFRDRSQSPFPMGNSQETITQS